MKILVLGSAGQLGHHLQTLLPEAQHWDRQQADLADPAALPGKITAAAPDCIINAAAYTAVDRAESEPALAWAVNAQAPALLAQTANALGALLIHVSTDYVFDGNAQQPYQEQDAVNPLNVYGRSKLAGELAVTSLCHRHWIFRTSWVFSEHGNNFVKTMLRLAAERDNLSIVDDQLGRPTYAGDLARLIATAADTSAAPSLPYGLYHCGGGPALSWRAFAQQIFELGAALGLIDRIPTVTPIATAAYPTPAIRPLRALMRPNPLLQQHLGISMDWQAGLTSALTQLKIALTS